MTQVADGWVRPRKPHYEVSFRGDPVPVPCSSAVRAAACIKSRCPELPVTKSTVETLRRGRHGAPRVRLLLRFARVRVWHLPSRTELTS